MKSPVFQRAVVAAILLSACQSNGSATAVPTLAAEPTLFGPDTAIAQSMTRIAHTQLARAMTPSLTPRPTLTPTSSRTPRPTDLPAKPVLLGLVSGGGDGGTLYYVFYGLGVPDLVLFTDGELFVSENLYPLPSAISRKLLSVAQMCQLLNAVNATGFFDVEGSGIMGPFDPIYRGAEFLGEGLGSYYIVINGSPSKEVWIEARGIPNLIPQVRNVLDLLASYRPSGMVDWIPDRLLVRAERYPLADFELPEAPVPERPWPASLPRLAALQNVEGDHVEFRGQESTTLLRLMSDFRPALFSDRGAHYIVFMRGLLPHQSDQNYLLLPSGPLSFELPFDCSR